MSCIESARLTLLRFWSRLAWRAPSQAYLVSSAMLSSPSSIGSGSGSLDFAADGVVLASGSVLSEATLYPFGGERPGNGGGGSAHVKTFFDIPRDSVFGPGMLVGHSVGGLASSRDAVDRLTLMDAVTTRKVKRSGPRPPQDSQEGPK